MVTDPGGIFRLSEVVDNRIFRDQEDLVTKQNLARQHQANHRPAVIRHVEAASDKILWMRPKFSCNCCMIEWHLI
jgi:hypothetical protein